MTNTTTNEIINFFKNNTDLFNNCIEQLDGYNGYLNDDRYYCMYDINEILSDKKPLEIMNMVFFGRDADNYTYDAINNKYHYKQFNPNANYFKFDGYGNLISTNYIDYSDLIDEYAISSIMENRQYIDSIDDNEQLEKLFNQLEGAII